MLKEIVKTYNEAVFDTDRERALRVVHDALARGVTPEEIIFKVVIPALEAMVKSISEDFDANLAQHFMASQIASEVTDEMVARFEKSPETIGQVVIGTAQGDMHSLGKRIVIGCLRAQMIGVTDLGVDVSAETFVAEAIACKAPVIAISAMMVHTATGEEGCLKVRQLLKERGLEERIKIIVGGAPFRWDHDLYRQVQADAWAEDGVTAAKIIKDLIQEVQA